MTGTPARGRNAGRMRVGEPDVTSDAIVCWNRIKQVDRWIPHGRSVRVIVLELVPEAGMYVCA